MEKWEDVLVKFLFYMLYLMQTVNAQHPPDSWKFPYPKAKSTLEFVHQEVTKVMSTDF